METRNEKIPDPKELEREIGEFLAKRFGGTVKIATPVVMAQSNPSDMATGPKPTPKTINFNLKPSDLFAYLDRYIVKQDEAKTVLSTKVCTHFNRIKRSIERSRETGEMVGGVKNNILMIGPTGVGKTYMVRLIAKKLGVPFVKGDATKFSETGYVGGDVDDLVRDLAREADGDVELAQYGIIYIDEIDKIASARNLVGADVSRTGVQRALLKPMEETEVDIRTPNDPVSMMQEIEKYRRTGKKEQTSINTRNILFIMSGAFNGLGEIIEKRIISQGMGFGAKLKENKNETVYLPHLKAEDLTQYGFESEFVGRLPVKVCFEKLEERDLYRILTNPNNPIMQGKKLDFDAYGIDIKFQDQVLRVIASRAFDENTGARGLVSAVEQILLHFENRLPSTRIKRFPATMKVLDASEEYLESLCKNPDDPVIQQDFSRLANDEKKHIQAYVEENKASLSEKHHIRLTPQKIDMLAQIYANNIMDMGQVVGRLKSYCDQVKNIEMSFFKDHDVNVVLEDDAIDAVIEKFIGKTDDPESFKKRFSENFEFGLKLVREKTGRDRFFINKKAIQDPDGYITSLLQEAKRELDKSSLEFKDDS